MRFQYASSNPSRRYSSLQCLVRRAETILAEIEPHPLHAKFEIHGYLVADADPQILVALAHHRFNRELQSNAQRCRPMRADLSAVDRVLFVLSSRRTPFAAAYYIRENVFFTYLRREPGYGKINSAQKSCCVRYPNR